MNRLLRPQQQQQQQQQLRQSVYASTRCLCSSSLLKAEAATEARHDQTSEDISKTDNAVETTVGHAGSSAAPPEMPEPPRSGSQPRAKAATLNKWLQGDGAKYRRPLTSGPNWLSKTPFPMNPSFNPKPPVSDRLRNLIYNVVKSELSRPNAPKESVVLRQVAQKHNLSIQRVAAIVKLKVAQEQFVGSGLALQKELNDGMEQALGVSQQVRLTEPAQGTKPILAHQMRQIFEMPNVEAGEQPILSSMLDQASEAYKADQAQSGVGAHQQKAAHTSEAASRTERVASRRKDKSPTMVVQDVSDLPLGRQWERSNRNDSASQAVQKERKAAREQALRENQVAWEGYNH